MVMDMDMKNKILFAVAFFVFAAFSVSAQPRKMTVYLVQHVHTDIGYTKPQTEILSEHLRYIDYALDYCDATASYPDDARFRWTCEASWAVDEWLRVRPKEQVERFLEYVRQGRIEVTAMFFNMSELSGRAITEGTWSR